MKKSILLLLMVILSLMAGVKKKMIDIYIDCERCDMEFIKTSIPFVNYVRERQEADVYILITTEITGSGGREFTLLFSGQNDFKGMEDTLKFITPAAESEDNIRRKMVKVLKLGLMRYVARTSVSDDINIIFSRRRREEVIDKWKHWVFSISTRGFFNGEQSKSSAFLNGYLSIRRVTEMWKTNISLYSNYNYGRFEINDTTVISSFSITYGSNFSLVGGINEHWSWGGFVYSYSSSYKNIKIEAGMFPAIEFNIFPYSQSTVREFRIIYGVGYNYDVYYEETIYDKMYEHLFKEYLTSTLELTQKWGSVSITLEGSHYFHDITKNRLSLYSDISLQLVRGLSFELSGGASLIHDQLSLPKRGLTPEEILLQRKQLATQYEYWGSVGFTFTFGSIYSNIVNPRFGNMFFMGGR